MKPSHEQYLKEKLFSARMKSKELETQHRIHMAVHEEKKSQLFEEIGSLERQLDGGTK